MCSSDGGGGGDTKPPTKSPVAAVPAPDAGDGNKTNPGPTTTPDGTSGDGAGAYASSSVPMVGMLFLLVVVALVCIKVGRQYASAIGHHSAASASAAQPQRGKYQNVYVYKDSVCACLFVWDLAGSVVCV